MSVENKLYYGILAFILLEYGWELYVSLRQHKIYSQPVEIPRELQGVLSPRAFSKARLYALDKSSFGIVKDFFSVIMIASNILFNGFVVFWTAAGRVTQALGYTSYNEIVQSMMFALLVGIFNTIFNMPFSAYYTFILEERHGFNLQTPGFFIKDKLKAFVVHQVIMLPLVAAIIYIVKLGGEYFFIYLWLSAVLMAFFLLSIYPNFIAPFFDKYTPLPDGQLRTRIEELAASIEFPLYRIYVVECSNRSAHSSAYLYGFFNKKNIVLFDTLLKDYVPGEKACNNDEVLAILGHELGHWKLNHILKKVVMMQVNLFLMFLVFGLLFNYEPMYNAFGFHDELPVVIGFLIVLQYVLTPYYAVIYYPLQILSRRFEFQADAFSKSLGKAKYLRQALIKLHQNYLEFPVYDWLYSTWHHNRPPLLERLKALDSKTD